MEKEEEEEEEEEEEAEGVDVASLGLLDHDGPRHAVFGLCDGGLAAIPIPAAAPTRLIVNSGAGCQREAGFNRRMRIKRRARERVERCSYPDKSRLSQFSVAGVLSPVVAVRFLGIQRQRKPGVRFLVCRAPERFSTRTNRTVPIMAGGQATKRSPRKAKGKASPAKTTGAKKSPRTAAATAEKNTAVARDGDTNNATNNATNNGTNDDTNDAHLTPPGKNESPPPPLGSAQLLRNCGAKGDQQNGTGDANKRIMTISDIETVQNLIEKCLQLYLTKDEVISVLRERATIDAEFTKLIWSRLEGENPQFFKCYNTRLKLKAQITMFNHLLEQQIDVVRRMNEGTTSYPPASATASGIPLFHSGGGQFGFGDDGVSGMKVEQMDMSHTGHMEAGGVGMKKTWSLSDFMEAGKEKEEWR